MKKGIIEGFYGIPWTFEERKSMINFLSEIAMDQYIYAPKDDPYHNKKWREPYPPVEIEKIKALADLARQKNIDFTWAIHPGQNPFDFESYDEEIGKIFAKYRQLMGVGVKSFGLCLDDIDKNLAYEKRFDHMKLIRDLADFVEKETGSYLYFVHPWYNDAWIDEKGYEYEGLLKDIKNVNLMWTGSQVVDPINHKSNEDFFKRTSKKPYIWFNWPVNDYKPSEIFLEIFEFYDSRDINFDGFYLNPMNQAEASKIAIYQANEYLKNPEKYQPEGAFKKAVKYLEPVASEDLIKIAPSFYGSLVYQRTGTKKFTEDMDLKKAFEEKNTEILKKLLEEKIKAIESYKKNQANQALYKEINPFVSSLENLVSAVLAKLEGNLNQAENYFEKAKNIKIQVLGEKGLEEINVKTSEVLEEIYQKI
ncbi:beta-N-acetylglucosaminidase domain-containing protein [Anaerococcus degeneri]|uniref:Beta-N-acetylglucosaminidase domain-containing protein n=1 Tax=Anaerococcus degeneri TaxID=361500 RepID=A0ABS7YYU1_9FIRM|nr:beta-N-acetylglucosaminidase domain-containing protein [Anaerococcus degeneri]MBP2015252.1 hyaluronoglucosaminidase [Anaerococcus degeneri]MCA2096148.1 beta-N-acetylglucosaminidase domain-containing protein [Anaerococcus degeneri]